MSFLAFLNLYFSLFWYWWPGTYFYDYCKCLDTLAVFIIDEVLSCTFSIAFSIIYFSGMFMILWINGTMSEIFTSGSSELTLCYMTSLLIAVWIYSSLLSSIFTPHYLVLCSWYPFLTLSMSLGTSIEFLSKVIFHPLSARTGSERSGFLLILGRGVIIFLCLRMLKVQGRTCSLNLWLCYQAGQCVVLFHSIICCHVNPFPIDIELCI